MLDRQPPGVRSVLLRTAVLDRMTGSLVDVRYAAASSSAGERERFGRSVARIVLDHGVPPVFTTAT